VKRKVLDSLETVSFENRYDLLVDLSTLLLKRVNIHRKYKERMTALVLSFDIDLHELILEKLNEASKLFPYSKAGDSKI